jgi:RNA polymerase sigma factor (sigma-70 family)
LIREATDDSRRSFVAESGNASEYSFEEFYLAEYPKLVRLVMRAGGTFAVAEEAAQEAMLQVLRNWHRLSSPSAWVRKAVLHEYYKGVTRDRKEAQLTQRTAQLNRSGYLGTDTDAAEPDEVENVRRAIRDLPVAQREVLALSFDGYGPTEIAALLGKRPETVRSNLREARKRLAAKLDKDSATLRGATDEKDREDR